MRRAILRSAELRQLERAAIEAGLAEPSRRNLLFRDFPSGYAESLPHHSRPADQLRSDLIELNEENRIEGFDQLPLAAWLKNALDLTVHSSSKRRILNDLLERIVDGQPLIEPSRESRDLRSRAEVIRSSLELLDQPTRIYYAAVVGPLFLHPKWYMERRDARVQLPNYDLELSKFVRQRSTERTHEIKFIFTFSDRYRAKVDTYVRPDERERFQQDMLAAIDDLWASGMRGPDICCVHPGFGHIQMIFDHAVITLSRQSQMLPTSDGVLSLDQDFVARERSKFERIVEHNSRGQQEEILILKEKITRLWQPNDIHTLTPTSA